MSADHDVRRRGFAQPRADIGPAGLVARAMHPPATGPEAVDWRIRGLAELLVHAEITNSDGLVPLIDRAAATCKTGSIRFVGRLRELRQRQGPVPATYPLPRTVPMHAPSPPRVVQAAAAELCRFADYVDDRSAHFPPAIRRELGTTQISQHLDRAAAWRVTGGHRHRCVATTVPSELLWRSWFVTDDGPVLAVASTRLTTDEAALMFGLHVGVHLDHARALIATGRPRTAADLQFGRGLLLAEALAMVAELAVLADSDRPDAWLTAARRRFLLESVADRVSRLPRLVEWGPALAPESSTMALAAARPQPEFATLPTLAAAYVLGPLRLLRSQFVHAAIPRTLAVRLRADPAVARLAKAVSRGDVGQRSRSTRGDSQPFGAR